MTEETATENLGTLFKKAMKKNPYRTMQQPSSTQILNDLGGLEFLKKAKHDGNSAYTVAKELGIHPESIYYFCKRRGVHWSEL